MKQQQDICPFLGWHCPSKYCCGEKYETCELAKTLYYEIQSEHQFVSWLRKTMQSAPFTQEEAALILQTIYNFFNGQK